MELVTKDDIYSYKKVNGFDAVLLEREFDNNGKSKVRLLGVTNYRFGKVYYQVQVIPENYESAWLDLDSAIKEFNEFLQGEKEVERVCD